MKRLEEQVMEGQITIGEEGGFYSAMGGIGSLDQGLGLSPKMSKVLSDGDGGGRGVPGRRMAWV